MEMVIVKMPSHKGGKIVGFEANLKIEVVGKRVG